MDPGRRATRLLCRISLLSITLILFIEPEKPKKPTIHMNKNEQNELGDVTPSMSENEDLTTGEFVWLFAMADLYVVE